MEKILLAFFMFITAALYGQQSVKEFEGVITYKTTITLKEKGLDIDKLYKLFGKERKYYFKAGKYKWVPQDVKLEFEIFNPTFSGSVIINKFNLNDTLFYVDMSNKGDTVASVKKGKKATVLNIPCNVATFRVTNENSNSDLFRTIYYPIDSLAYANSYYDKFKAMGQNYIARYTNALPLRMEMDRKEQPFVIIYEATNIEWKSIPDKEFQVDGTLPVKKQ